MNTGGHHSEKTKRKISESSFGKHHSEASKRKIRDARQGKHLSKETKRKLREINSGKKLSEETKKKMSKVRVGEKHHNWKGGISPLGMQIRNCFRYRGWVSDVFTRDNFICQECGKRGGYLHAHHLKSFSQIFHDNKIKTLEDAESCGEFWNINNGRTLCKECHRNEHKLHGEQI